jgi:hypothetical protein
MVGRPGHGKGEKELLVELAHARLLLWVVLVLGAEDVGGPGAPAASTSWMSG